MIRKVIFILVCLVALSSCHWNGGKSSDSAELNIKVARYDRLLFEYVTMNNLSALQKMNTDFPQATKLLIEDVLAIDRKSTRLNSSHNNQSRMPSSA